jgi:hypothetical protein
LSKIGGKEREWQLRDSIFSLVIDKRERTQVTYENDRDNSE